jgi:uncharacterized membrane protein
MPESQPPPQGSGLTPNVAGALSYILGPFTGVLFLIISKEPFVRFHALQSIAVSIAWVGVWMLLAVVGFILGNIPLLGWLLNLFLWGVLSLAGFVLWVFLMYQALQGREWELPIIGKQVRRYSLSGGPPPQA